jgi:uncharacterized protein YlxW (UPF0749 family)
MNPFEMVVIIVAIVCIASVLKSRRLARSSRRDGLIDVTPGSDDSDRQRLREEVQQLKNRIQVLERIAVEKENSLEREIDQLRDR